MKKIALLLAFIAGAGGWYVLRIRTSPTAEIEAQIEGTPPSDDSRSKRSEHEIASPVVDASAGQAHMPRNAVKTGAAYFLSSRPREAVNWGWFPEPGSMPLELPPPTETKQYPGELNAVSPEDAAWLDRHGYPTQEELDALDTTSELELAERASTGDLASMALLGLKQMRENKILEGTSNLNESAMLGSIWALFAIGDLAKRQGATVTAFEYYQLAALRGDWVTPPKHLQSGLRPEIKTAQLLFTPSRVAQLYANMQRLRALRGLPPLGIDTRPHPFNRPSGHEPVGVYRRQRSKRK